MHHAHHAHGGGNATKAHDSMQCSMAMTWNTDVTGMCIVHPVWRISTIDQFVLTLMVIAVIAAFYEYMKWAVQCVDVAIMRAAAPGGARRRRRGTLLGDDDDDATAAPGRSRPVRRSAPPSAGVNGDVVLPIEQGDEDARGWVSPVPALVPM